MPVLKRRGLFGLGAGAVAAASLPVVAAPAVEMAAADVAMLPPFARGELVPSGFRVSDEFVRQFTDNVSNLIARQSLSFERKVDEEIMDALNA